MGQFRWTYALNHHFIIQNYKTDNPIYDLQNHFSYSPEFRIGLQGSDVAIFFVGIQSHFMGGKSGVHQKIGAYYLLFPLSTTFLWKFYPLNFQGYFDTGLQYGRLFSSYAKENQGIFYDFHPNYWGVHFSPGIEYNITSQFSMIFQTYYTLQFNDASKNFFIGKFHNYGLKLGIRYLKEQKS